MAQYTKGAFSRYTTPSSRAVTQSPEVSMFRAICAWTASTSSMRDGGETMHPRYTAPATSNTPRYRYQFFPVSRHSSLGALPPESPTFSSTETTPSIPIVDIQHSLVSPGELESASRLRPAGKLLREPKHHPSTLAASAGANSHEDNHARECRNRPSSVEAPNPAACRALIPSGELSVANRESSAMRAGKRRIPRCGDRGTAAALPENAPCSYDLPCSECRREENISDRTTNTAPDH